jgi:hypothetical protein
MIRGEVRQLSADATEAPSANTRSDALGGRDRPMGPLAYRALAAARARRLLRSPRAMRVANRISATTMGGAAVAIAAK